ncbi:hypothetical protein LCD36_28295 [Saccharopolyspora sp. 6T]|uniref:hypothetical protein n=1 Tax=Saccharopolyspora sp. 6T TaxID=2877238 RepID=UPI001CD5A507|nr:hypothetical protein [Saccharopolyspora sp. 6T]MCA1190322.1 hypothetical protein [Saccharopolyspora sp. 6T]
MFVAMFAAGWFAASVYLAVHAGALVLLRSKPRQRADADKVFRLALSLAAGSVGIGLFSLVPIALGLLST